jgi:hypothetical protein
MEKRTNKIIEKFFFQINLYDYFFFGNKMIFLAKYFIQ